MPGAGDTRNLLMSPGALRRKYLPRNPRDGRTQAHPAAAAAAAQPQKKHPHAPNGTKRQTENATTTNRSPRMTRFKPGFEQETEEELARAFSRFPRTFKEDTPFYPWLPHPTPIVNFHLNLSSRQALYT